MVVSRRKARPFVLRTKLGLQENGPRRPPPSRRVDGNADQDTRTKTPTSVAARTKTPTSVAACCRMAQRTVTTLCAATEASTFVISLRCD
jgi:hypothetical protein